MLNLTKLLDVSVFDIFEDNRLSRNQISKFGLKRGNYLLIMKISYLQIHEGMYDINEGKYKSKYFCC